MKVEDKEERYFEKKEEREIHKGREGDRKERKCK